MLPAIEPKLAGVPIRPLVTPDDGALRRLIAMTTDELAKTDPVVLNLTVARGIAALSEIDVQHYADIVDGWVSDFQSRCFPQWEPYFFANPEDFRNDNRFFMLGMICQYLETEAGIEYIEDQREAKEVWYTEPSDLFINGVIDTKRGTCGSMAALHLAFAWRLGLPVSIACAKNHIFIRLEDGDVVHNIEATQSGFGGFSSGDDDAFIERFGLPPIAIESGSDLRALTPHEVLGVFVSLRARHVRDVSLTSTGAKGLTVAEPDWLIARSLFPKNRVIYREQMVASAHRGEELFTEFEPGHPASLGNSFTG